MVKKIRASTKENELYILPADSSKMREFVDKFKIDMMLHIVSSIKFAVENKIPIVEVFQFKNSPFVVTIAEKEFMSNLDHIIQYYKEHEIYELCTDVENLRRLLKNKHNEKENKDDSEFDDPGF